MMPRSRARTPHHPNHPHHSPTPIEQSLYDAMEGENQPEEDNDDEDDDGEDDINDEDLDPDHPDYDDQLEFDDDLETDAEGAGLPACLLLPPHFPQQLR